MECRRTLIVLSVENRCYDDIIKTLTEVFPLNFWAFIYHDNEKLCPHYHVYLDFGADTFETSYLAEVFNTSVCNVVPCSAFTGDCLLYMLQNGGYDKKDIISNFNINYYLM